MVFERLELTNTCHIVGRALRESRSPCRSSSLSNRHPIEEGPQKWPRSASLTDALLCVEKARHDNASFMLFVSEFAADYVSPAPNTPSISLPGPFFYLDLATAIVATPRQAASRALQTVQLLLSSSRT